MNGVKRMLVVLLVGFGFAAHAESVLTTAKPEEVGWTGPWPVCWKI